MSAIQTRSPVFVPFYVWHNDEAPAVTSRPAPLTISRVRGSMMADPDLAVRVSVYKVTCLENGREYVGITRNGVRRRWMGHLRAARNQDKKPLYRAIRKYGKDAFVVEELFVAIGEENACIVERLLVETYGTLHPDGYNMSGGGEGYAGRQLSEDSRQRVSAIVKALWADPVYRESAILAAKSRVMPEHHIEHLRRLAAGIKGKPEDPKRNAARRAALVGHDVSPETRAKIGASRKGKALWSDERKAAFGEAVRAAHGSGAYKESQKTAGKTRWANPDYRAKYVPPMLGRTHSEETKRKIGDANRGRIHSEEHKAKVKAALTGRKRPGVNANHLAQFGSTEKNLARLRAMNDARRGSILPESHRKAISAAMVGKKRGPYKKKNGGAE